MSDSIAISLSGLVALDQRLSTVATNVANARTVGFRSTEVTFEERLNRLDQTQMSFVTKGAEKISDRQGALEQTGNVLDFAINGSAWFAVDSPAGPVMTRDGRFTVQSDGRLTNLSGDSVLDAGGAPIELPTGGGDVNVSSDGLISVNGTQISGIGLFTFDPNSGGRHYGQSGFLANGALTPVIDEPTVSIQQGFVEQSNVDPVSEITRLITLQRSFEQASSMIDKTDDNLQRLIQAMGRG
jgi:flagellar basal-body rod protein FlgF